MKYPIRIPFFVCLCASLTSFGVPAFAQTTDHPTASKEVTQVENKQVQGPFHGKLATLDKPGRSFTVGKRTFHVTSDTKIFKAGKTATLADAVVGEEISGGFKTGTDGRLYATKVNIGPKLPAQTKK